MRVTLKHEPSFPPVLPSGCVSSSPSFWFPGSLSSSSPSLAARPPSRSCGWFSLSSPLTPLCCCSSSSSSSSSLLLLLVLLVLLLSSLSCFNSPWLKIPLPAPPPRNLTPLPRPRRSSPFGSSTKLWGDCWCCSDSPMELWPGELWLLP